MQDGTRAALDVLAAGVGALAAGAAVFAYASQWPESQLFGRALIAGSDPKELALTYDDGPNPAATAALLDVLARHGVRATFFIIGGFARKEPGLVKAVAAAGHVVANHTMTHPKLSLVSAARVRAELTECKAVLEDLTGQPVRYFRPPFGSRRPYVLRVARELGMTPVLWNVTGFDWEPLGVERLVGNLDRGIARNRRRGVGSNLLLHDGGHLGLGAARMDTVRATERVLEAYGEMRFVGVDAWGESIQR
jgi:peptidoglycan/xylan/chitin deacetylase (PgdA/CDA1 family)